MSKLFGHLLSQQTTRRVSFALGFGRMYIADHGTCRAHTSSPAPPCGISSCVCDKYRKVEFAWSLSFGSTAMYIAYSYGDTALTDTDQEQGVPASGQHGKPRHWNHKYHGRPPSLREEPLQQSVRYTLHHCCPNYYARLSTVSSWVRTGPMDIR
jgi:hypothetical protein